MYSDQNIRDHPTITEKLPYKIYPNVTASTWCFDGDGRLGINNGSFMVPYPPSPYGYVVESVPAVTKKNIGRRLIMNRQKVGS